MESSQKNNPPIITKLFDATIQGNLNSLYRLLREDPLILDRCIFEKSDRFMQSPLHIASNLGHFEFTTEILRLNPELAKQHDQSNRSTALHLASEKGHLNIVRKLVEVNPNLCLARDQDGRNPIHIAAINNKVNVLEWLVQVNPNAARQRTNKGDTILHLCVNHAQLDSLKYLVNEMGELLNAIDNDGNTVLHLAVLAKQLEFVKFLVTNQKMQRNTVNKNGLTAIDCVIIQGEKYQNDTDIFRALKRAKTVTAKRLEKRREINGKWLKEQRNALMVVASLIATMAFQAGVNHLSLDNSSTDNQPGISPSSDVATGDATPVLQQTIIMANTISLVSSLSVVLLLISGLPFKRLFVVVLMICMWVAITATIYTYIASLVITIPWEDDGIWIMATIVVGIWAILVAVLLFGHIFRFLIKLIKKLVHLVKKMLRKSACNRGHNLSSSTIL